MFYKATLLAAALAAACFGQTNVLTYHNDLSRTGANLNENILSPDNTSAASFGKLFSHTVDGQIFAQPLYMAGVAVAGKGRHNVVFVATEGDSVYAFDADNSAGANADPLWQIAFANGQNIVPIPTDLLGGQDDQFGCFSVNPQVGITSTPVIDPASMTLYTVAVTKEISGNSTNYVHRVHAIDITTGAERPGSGAAITGPPGAAYYPQWMIQRSGLLLLSGKLYIGFAAVCDQRPYNGMMVQFDAATLQQMNVSLVTSPGDAGGIWGSGGAPAVDQSGSIYVAVGNGIFDGASSFACSLLRLNSQLQVQDYFTPTDVNSVLNPADLDLGSSMPVLLPDSDGAGTHPHLAAIGGKEGYVYLIDRDKMEQWSPISNALALSTSQYLGGQLFGKSVYFNHKLFFSPGYSPVQSLIVSNAQLSFGTQTPQSYEYYAGPGMSVSANSAGQGILWVLARDNSGYAALQAFNPENLQQQYYTSGSGGADALGGYVQFTVPTVVQGKVYASSGSGYAGGSLVAFGLKSAVCAADVSAQVLVARGGWHYNHTTNSYIETITLTNNGKSALGPVSLAVDNLSPAAQLTSASGTTSCGTLTGSFYQDALLPGGSLAPGQSVPLYISATDSLPENIGFDTRILAGQGIR